MEIRTSLSSTVPATAVRMPGEGSDVLPRQAPTATSTASTIEALGEGPSYCDQILDFFSYILQSICDFFSFFCTEDQDESAGMRRTAFSQNALSPDTFQARLDDLLATTTAMNSLRTRERRAQRLEALAKPLLTYAMLTHVLAAPDHEINFYANTKYTFELSPEDFEKFTKEPAELSLNSLIPILEKALNTQFTCGQTGEGAYEIKIDTEASNTINLTLDFDLTLQAHAKNDVNAID